MTGVHALVAQATQVLEDLGLPPGQHNERSALTLLALLDLTPGKTWQDVEAPLMGVTPIMTFMRQHYGKDYAPNTRETVRRETLHQFLAAGVVVQNPDDPQRPTNSAKNVYQVPVELLDVLRLVGTVHWGRGVAAWHSVQPALLDRWAKERQMAMVPVTLPSGTEISLTPGGQNPLIKAIIEEFGPRFAPGADVLYIGDTGSKFVVWEHGEFDALGVSIDEHGKMPDVVLLDRQRGWLFLVEAVTSHGPVDAKRHDELSGLFRNASAGLIFVTAFMDRRTFAGYLGDIGWETEVWVAEAPTHLVHFDGERFLGPYQ
jgi:hypothetical protein